MGNSRIICSFFSSLFARRRADVGHGTWVAQLTRAAQGQNAKEVPELPKPEMHIVDMSKAEVDFAIEVAKKGIISLFKNERRSFCEVAQFIKKEFDKTFSGAWHVFVGKHFGAWVTYEAHKLVYFHIGQ
ncbi:Dynein light chain LC6, partial [Durusdinium trenchii]